jgi:glycosyltransferase involved in cell wall biosynthesis
MPSDSAFQAVSYTRSPLKYVFKLYYRLGLWALVFLLRRRDEVRAIWLLDAAAMEGPPVGRRRIATWIVLSDDTLRPSGELRARLTWLGKVFTFFAAPPQSKIVTPHELQEIWKRQSPHLFSIEGCLKPLWSRGGIEGTLPYQQEHELSLLRALWPRVIFLLGCEGEDNQTRRITENVVDSIRQLNRRVGRGEKWDPPRRTSAEGLVESFLDAIAFLRGLPEAAPKAGEEKPVTIPCFLYRETAPLTALAGRACRDTVKIKPMTGKNGFGKRVAREIRRAECDYVLWEEIGLPVVEKDDMAFLGRATHPKTFQAIDEARRGEERAGQWELTASELEKSAVYAENRFLITRLERDESFLFSIPPDRLPFALATLLEWKGGQPHSAIRAAREAVVQYLRETKVSEAYFRARESLSGSPARRLPPRISVAVVTRNHAASLKRAMESLAAQELLADEIIVIDRGSTDETRESWGELHRMLPRLKIRDGSGLGVTAARNLALRECDPSAEVVAFFGEDCEASPEWLYELTVPFRYDSRIAACGGTVSLDEVGRTLWSEFQERATQTEVESGRHQYLPSARYKAMPRGLPPENVAFRKTAFESAGFFDESLEGGEDLDAAVRLGESGELFLNPRAGVVKDGELSLGDALRQWWRGVSGQARLMQKYSTPGVAMFVRASRETRPEEYARLVDKRAKGAGVPAVVFLSAFSLLNLFALIYLFSPWPWLQIVAALGMGASALFYVKRDLRQPGVPFARGLAFGALRAALNFVRLYGTLWEGLRRKMLLVVPSR